MKAALLLFLAGMVTASADDRSWLSAEPGWPYAWPKDHVSHAQFKTEWWYFTGNLRAEDGRRFGYQLTFFRQGARPPGSAPARSRFVVSDLKFGHFTLTDLAQERFTFSQKLTRGAFGEAGFGDGVADQRLAWLEGWSLSLEKDGAFALHAADGDRSLDLRLVSAKPWIVHGENGISSKSAEPGHAS